MYNLVESANSSLTLEVAVPGLRKEDLSVTFENGTLTIENISEEKMPNYVVHKIKQFVKESFTLGPYLKVDLVTYSCGMLYILLSQKMEAGSKIVIH
jgi:HSP20 family molecular chaperone IbpA